MGEHVYWFIGIATVMVLLWEVYHWRTCPQCAKRKHLEQRCAHKNCRKLVKYHYNECAGSNGTARSGKPHFCFSTYLSDDEPQRFLQGNVYELPDV